MSEPDDIDEGPARVVPMTQLQVVTQPGSVKVLHRSGRVVWTFTGPTLMADAKNLRDQLDDLLGDGRRYRREVLLKPWWKFW